MEILTKSIIITLIALVITGCTNNIKTTEDTTRTSNLNKSENSKNAIQSDSIVFHKTLSLQNISFDISTTGQGSIQKLFIQPSGLKEDNQKIVLEVDGQVINAEIEDMNSDAYPEVLIYTVSSGSGSYGNVIGYSVNSGKSISSIYFPDISENQEAGKGYMGHDEFAIVETTLVQRFQTYNEGDANAMPTGNIREIQYKLVDGEASRKFIINNIVEYAAQSK